MVAVAEWSKVMQLRDKINENKKDRRFGPRPSKKLLRYTECFFTRLAPIQPLSSLRFRGKKNVTEIDKIREFRLNPGTSWNPETVFNPNSLECRFLTSG